MLAVHLSAFWRTIPQYAFGWLVLPLAAYFLHRRWQSVPFEPARASWASPVALVCALLMLPAWMIRTAAPHSYHVSYGMALLAAGFTLALLAHGGGWRMARYMAFPVLFVFCAVPWSRHLEGPLIESLTRMVTIVTVEALQLSGVAATRTGNLVSLSTGTLDVAEACSGIRSFQSMIMAALALGELHRFGVTRRIALVGIGAGLALFFNLLRNYLLAVLAHSRGLGAIDTWHDASGWGIFLISFYLLHQLSERMEGGFEPPRREPPALRKFPAWAGPALSVWFITVVAATEGWYRSHEHNITETITVEWPRRKNSYRIQPVPPATREFLRCSSIEIAAWSEENATQWILSAVRWDPGETSTNAAQSHHPEVCLPAIGLAWKESYPLRRLAIEGGDLLFTSSRFEKETRPIFSFFTFYEESDRQQQNAWFDQDFSFRGDLRRALIGRRDLGKQTLEIVVNGFSTYEEALDAVSRALPSLARFRRVSKEGG